MEEEKKVSEETKVKVQEANPYSKVRDTDDAEIERLLLLLNALQKLKIVFLRNVMTI